MAKYIKTLYLHINMLKTSSIMSIKRLLYFATAIAISLMSLDTLAQTNEMSQQSDSLYDIGIKLSKEGNYEEAIRYFSESYSIDTVLFPLRHVKREHSLRQIARCYFMLGDTAKAYSISPTCVAQQPDRRLTEKSDSLIILCKAYISEKNFPEALSSIEKAQAAMKKSIGTKTFLYANLLENKMTIFINTGEADKFIECLKEIASVREISLGKTNPQYIATIENIGLAYEIFKKDFTKSAENYAIAAELYEKSPYANINSCLKALTNLGYALLKTNQTERSIEVLTKAYKIIKEHNLENHKNLGVVTNLLAHCYNNMEEFEKSLELYKENAEYEKRNNGEKSMSYAISLNNIGIQYFDLHDYYKAIEMHKKGLEIIREISGENNINIAAQELGIGNAYNELEIFDSAIVHYQKTIDVYEHNEQTKSLLYADALSNIANSYNNKSDYEKASQYYLRAKKIYEDNMTENDIIDYTNVLTNYSSNLIAIGRYEEALQLMEKSLDIRKKYLGENSIRLSTILNNMANVYTSIGDYTNALKLFYRSAEIKKQTYGEYDDTYAVALSNIGTIYNYKNDNANAYKTLTKSLYIYEKLQQDSSFSEKTGHINTLINMGNYYLHISNYEKSLECYTKALGISQKLLGTNSIEYIKALGNIANLYSTMKDYKKSLEYSIMVKESLRQIYGTEDHPDYANALVQLGTIYNYLLDSVNTIKNYTKALDIYGKVIGTDNFEYAKTLMNIGMFYDESGDYNKALEYETKSINIMKGERGAYHPTYIKALENISSLYFKMGDMKSALEKQVEAMIASKHNLNSNFSFMTANERETYWNTNNSIYRNITKMAGLMPTDTNAVNSAYNSELITKGLLLASEINFTNIIVESGDSLLVEKYEKMKRMHFLLNKDLERPITERIYNSDSLADEIQELERELVESSSSYGNLAQSITIEWEDVKTALGKNDIAIEFTNYSTNDTIKYAAILLSKEMETPLFVNLTDQYTLSDIVNGISRNQTDEKESDRGASTLSSRKLSVYESTDMYELLWKPLEKYFTDHPRIYFAPSGMLHKIGIEYAPVDKEQNISDKYEIYRISSSRDLALEHITKPINSCTLYGGIRYDSDTSTMKTESERYATRGISPQTYVSFADLNKDEDRSTLPYLPGTKDEIDEIKAILKKKKIKAEVHEGSTANEESIKQLSGNGSSILHVATHGFFLSSGDKLSGDNALLQSGLLFSGANYAWQNLPIPEGVEDGILTAKEISNMDLRKTNLVVLSACQTALGEITGEGVFGLQRGFKKAGVGTIIMSLWSVDDRATQIMMVEFYTNLAKGSSKREAFLAAQNKVKTTAGLENPRYWAAFIMLDGNE